MPWITELVRVDASLTFLNTAQHFPLPLDETVSLFKGYNFALTQSQLSFVALKYVTMGLGFKTFFTSLSIRKMLKCLLIKLCKDFSNVTLLAHFCLLTILMLVDLTSFMLFWFKCWGQPRAWNRDFISSIYFSKSFPYKHNDPQGLTENNRAFGMAWVCRCKVQILMAACRLNV